MQAYNPSVNDRSGEILGNATSNAATTRAQGMIAMSQGIGDGLTALGEGIGGMVKDARDKTAKLEGIASTGQALMDILPTYGEEGMALGAALTDNLTRAGNNPDKLAGAMMAFMPAFQNLQSRHNQQAATDGYLDLHRQKQAINALYAPAATPAAAPRHAQSEL
jgi:hypothetical protein